VSKSIEFPGTAGNRYDYDPIGSNDLTGASTLLIVQRMLAANGSWQSLIETQAVGPNGRPSLGRRNTGNELYYSDSTGLNVAATITILSSQNWSILALARPAGAAQTVRAHYFQVGGGAATHENVGGTWSNEAAYTTGKAIIAGDDDPANIRVAAWALWKGTAISDGTFDTICSALSTQSLIDAGASAVFDAENTLMKDDLVGSMDGALVGAITESSDGPTGWTYFGSSAQNQLAWIRA